MPSWKPLKSLKRRLTSLSKRSPRTSAHKTNLDFTHTRIDMKAFPTTFEMDNMATDMDKDPDLHAKSYKSRSRSSTPKRKSKSPKHKSKSPKHKSPKHKSPKRKTPKRRGTPKRR